MKNEMIEALEKKGFKRWTKGTMDRLYINPTCIGLELYYYNTGNVSSAYLNGERISNTSGREMKDAKCYINVATGDCVSDYDVFVEAMKQILAETEAELDAVSSDSDDESIVTVSAVDEEMPSLDYFLSNYFYHGFSGNITGKCCLRRVVIRLESNGEITAHDYGYGEAMLVNDYIMDGLCVDIAESVSDWMRGDIERSDVVETAVAELLAKKSEQED